MQVTTVRQHTCDYCGGSLDPRYHFCTHCATVYREPDDTVYGESVKPKPSLETKIATEAGSAWKFFCIIAIGLVTFGTLAEIMGEERIATSIAIQEIFLAVVTFGYMIYHWRDVASLFTRLRPDWLLFASLPALAVLLCVNKIYHDFVMTLLGLEDQSVLDPLLERMSPAALIFSICIFPGVVEELGFRAVVQERMVRAVGVTVGFIATSVLFVALHFSIFSAPYLFALSMFLCWVRHRTRSIYPSIVLHFVHNFVVLVVFYGVRG